MKSKRSVAIVTALIVFIIFPEAYGQSFKFWGVSTGEARAQVIGKMKITGFPNIVCDKAPPPPEMQDCYASGGISPYRHVDLRFEKGIFVGMTFDFPADVWVGVYNSVVNENGQPTAPLHQLGRGLSVDWSDRDVSQCPCEDISLVRDGEKTSFMWVNAPLFLALGR